MILTKRLSRKNVKKKQGRWLLWLRKKVPSFARELENSPLGNLFSQTKIDRYAPTAKRFVEEFYGVEIEHPNIVFTQRSVSVAVQDAWEFYRQVEKYAQQGNNNRIRMLLLSPFYRLFFEVKGTLHNLVEYALSSATYHREVETAVFPRSLELLRDGVQSQGVWIHEYVHHATSIDNLGIALYSGGERALAAHIVHEGVASYAQHKYLKEQGFKPSIRTKAVKLIGRVLGWINDFVFYPIWTLRIFRTYLKTKDREKSEIHDIVRRDIKKGKLTHLNPYKYGYEFIEDLARLGLSTQDIFPLVTEIHRPTLREIFYPEEYVARVK